MSLEVGFLRSPRHLAAIAIVVLCGSAIAVWLIARGELVGADARAYWGGARLWLAGGDPMAPPDPYLPFVYFPWTIPLFLPWAALPWETAWLVWHALNILLLVWTATWAYAQHPLATALFLALITGPVIATLDTGNITLFCALAIWAAYFSGPRVGGFLWALVTTLKWFPLVLFPVLPPRARLWGLAFLALAALLTVAVWPESVRQLEIAIGYPRPLRLDYILLLWATVPWLWERPHLLDARSWPDQARAARADLAAAYGAWRSGDDRLGRARATAIREARSFLGIG
jgi:hypothetical protein